MGAHIGRDFKMSLLTGGDDPTYAIPLAAALADQGVHVEFVGNDEMARSERLRRPDIDYLNLRGNQDPRASVGSKIVRILRYYARLITYARRTDARLFHILWFNKFELVDRTLLNIFYKLTGKKLVFTAHNVNTRKRDGQDTWLNRATLRVLYALVDHIFVHTELSRTELVCDYRVPPHRITVIPFGLNTDVPDTPLSKVEARAVLGLGAEEHVVLFFGQIAPYKGLDLLVEALEILSYDPQGCRLIIAGRSKIGTESYWRTLKSRLASDRLREHALVKDGFIPAGEVPILFTAADALVLPYRAIYQSGPLSLAYRFGVPVIATRVGSFHHDVIPEVTGFLCESENPGDLARAIRRYFDSTLYFGGEQTKKRIQEIAHARYSWDQIARTIVETYARLSRGGVLTC
jgi:D-inositol-3-phosphate glycosyltransferase